MEENNYIVNSSEKTQHSATKQETKTLLYLMSGLDDSKDVDTFVIDVCNDVVAVKDDCYYDSQAKGDKQCSPKDIGKDSVTLYKDYLSILTFNMYLLSVRDVSLANLKVLNDEPIYMLKVSDFTDDAQRDIKDALINECCSKAYIRDHYKDYLLYIDEFLEEVIILVNNDEECNYISKISYADMSDVSSEELSSIFDEIRTKQLSIKTRNNVNGIKLSCNADQLKVGRNFDVKVINTLVFERIVGMSMVNVNNTSACCPLPFMKYLLAYSSNEDEQQELLQECVSEIYKSLCNTNLNKDFWELIYAIFDIFHNNQTISIDDAYELLKKNNSGLVYLSILNKDYYLLYLISCIKEKYKNEH